MKTINKQTEILPGLIKLYLTPVINIKYISLGLIHITNPDLIFKINHALDSLKIVSQPVLSEKGDYFDINLQTFIPGASDEAENHLNNIKRFTLLCIYQESDGNFYRVGNQSVGLKLEYIYSSGNRDESIKGYSITLSGKLLLSAKKCESFLMHNTDQIPL